MTKRAGETVSLNEATMNLSALVERAARGEVIVISKSGRPRAALVPLSAGRPLRISGQGKGKWRVTKGFDASLADELIADFER